MNNHYFQKEIETRSSDELRSEQVKRLQNIVRHVFENNDIQRKRLQERGVQPGYVKSWDDLSRLPFVLEADATLALGCGDLPDGLELAETFLP